MSGRATWAEDLSVWVSSVSFYVGRIPISDLVLWRGIVALCRSFARDIKIPATCDIVIPGIVSPPGMYMVLFCSIDLVPCVNLPASSRCTVMMPIVPLLFQLLGWDWALAHIRWQQMHVLVLHQV
jgi:hypothetical protein